MDFSGWKEGFPEMSDILENPSTEALIFPAESLKWGGEVTNLVILKC
ncbi:MAG TPA: hypothetical protein VJH22_07405 [Candidatus Nanoarchaeia archaeon]|nr:hypothetical protein [Candidatus Nanoarchaeia archaeon]